MFRLFITADAGGAMFLESGKDRHTRFSSGIIRISSFRWTESFDELR